MMYRYQEPTVELSFVLAASTENTSLVRLPSDYTILARDGCNQADSLQIYGLPVAGAYEHARNAAKRR